MVQAPPNKHRQRNPYTQILSTPGALWFSASGVIARLPMSMVGIGTVLMIQGIYGSYSLAGQVSAVLVVAGAICSPPIARLVDRRGQRRIMLPMLVATTCGLGGLILSGVMRAPEWTLFLFAAIAGGTSGSYGSMVRARWSHALHDARKLHTAYSLEAALDELVFVIGPAAATMLATSVSPSSGLIVPLVAGVGGGLWFLAQRRTEPPVIVAQQGEKHRPAILSGGMIVLAIVFIAMGSIFGATDISTVAFATEQGQKGMSGAILAVFALGSGISGLLYGSRHWVSPLWKRFVIGMCILAVGVSLFFLVNSLVMLAVVMFVTGFAISPTLVNGNGLVQHMVAPAQLTEGLAWVGTSLGIGVSIGNWIAGVRIDAVGAHAGFQVVMISAVGAVVVSLASLSVLRKKAPSQPVE